MVPRAAEAYLEGTRRDRPRPKHVDPASHRPVEHEHVEPIFPPESAVLLLPQPEAGSLPRGHRPLHVTRAIALPGVVPSVAFEVETVSLRGPLLDQRAVASRLSRAIHPDSPHLLTHDPGPLRSSSSFRRKLRVGPPVCPAHPRPAHPSIDRYGRSGVSRWTDTVDPDALIQNPLPRRPSGPAPAPDAVHAPIPSLGSGPSPSRSRPVPAPCC